MIAHRSVDATQLAAQMDELLAARQGNIGCLFHAEDHPRVAPLWTWATTPSARAAARRNRCGRPRRMEG